MGAVEIEYIKNNKMKEYGVDMLLVTDQYNMRYLAAYRGEGVVVYTRFGQYVLTDSRYTEQAGAECPSYEVVDIAKTGYEGAIGDIACSLSSPGKALRVGFENMSVSYSRYELFRKAMPEAELVPLDDGLDALREIKDDDEIEKLRTAESIGDAAFEHILGYLKEGITEKEVALELEYYMKRNGADGLSFDTIAASGSNSSMPHAIPTDRKLRSGDFLTMDFGCVYDGYCSDMTRTVAIGRADEAMRKVYATVLEAQKRALDGIRSGIRCNKVDSVARDIIGAAGYGEFFGHGLGHSVGLYIHENPRFSPSCSDVLQPGMVITVEPGIYLPLRFGVRIEDLIVVTTNGHINLTSSPKELIII